jgi:hypothetical protein
MADKLLDFVSKRKKTIEQKRRSFERVLFQNFLGAYTVLDTQGSVYPVELVDVSHEGCLFQIPWNPAKDKKFEENTEFTMRMYFTKKSYIPVVVNIKYGKELIEEDGTTHMQYGCEFDTSLPSFDAMKNFIDFVYSFAEHSTIDKNEKKVFFL